MKMKTRYSILAAVILSITVLYSGCDDNDFLTEKPKTLYTIENSFNTVSQVQASVDNQYQDCLYYFEHSYFWKGAGTDFYDSPLFRSGNGGSGYSNFALWSTTYSNTGGLYNYMYALISYANQTLDGIASTSLKYDSESQKANFVAQCEFFRGFAYLVLGECFGGVPLVTHFYETPKYDFVRSTRSETYQQAIDDLTAAADSLPTYPEEAGRVSKGTAYHFLSEAYLAQATDQSNDKSLLEKSVAAASEVIQLHPLMTERFGTRANPNSTSTVGGVAAYYPNGDVFFDLFQPGNQEYGEGNTESLWVFINNLEIYHQYGGAQFLEYPYRFDPVLRGTRWLSQYIQGKGANACPFDGNIDTQKYPGGNICAYVGGKGTAVYSPTNYLKNYIWRDEFSDDMRNDSVNIRRKFVCMDRNNTLMYGKVVTEDMITSATRNEFYPIWTKIAPIDDYGYEGYDAGYEGTRDHMFRDDYACRSAETYLLRAEAYYREGNLSAAAADLNTLRKRAKCTYLFPSDGTGIDIYTILDERARELAYEERRWCTLLRMESGVLATELKNHAMYTADYPVYTADISWSLFPFPQTVIDSNSGHVLEQNPGW